MEWNNETIDKFAARVLKRSRRRLKRKGRHLDRLSPEGRHRIRIMTKKPRYASEFFASLWADRKHRAQFKSFISPLEDLQTGLGELNDIQTGRQIVSDLKQLEVVLTGASDAELTTRSPRDRLDKRPTALLSSVREAYQRLSAAKPFWKG